MSLKLKEEMNHLLLSNALIDDDDYNLIFELEIFVKKIKKKVIGVIDSFLSFMARYDERRTHSMLTLMLDPRLKSLKLTSSFISCVNPIYFLIENIHFK
jgi:hypothetical protein